MTKSYIEITADINRGVGKIRAVASDATAGFSALAKGAMKPGMLSSQLKKLIALALEWQTIATAALVSTSGPSRLPRARRSSRRWLWPCTWAAVRHWCTQLTP